MITAFMISFFLNLVTAYYIAYTFTAETLVGFSATIFAIFGTIFYVALTIFQIYRELADIK